MIKGVEKFCTELELNSLSCLETLQHNNIRIEEARSVENVPSRISKTRMACHKRSLKSAGRETTSVEPTADSFLSDSAAGSIRPGVTGTGSGEILRSHRKGEAGLVRSDVGDFPPTHDRIEDSTLVQEIFSFAKRQFPDRAHDNPMPRVVVRTAPLNCLVVVILRHITASSRKSLVAFAVIDRLGIGIRRDEG